MKRSILISVFALLVLSLALVLTNCGSSGGGGGGGGIDIPSFNWSCTDTPSYTVDGTWYITDTKCQTSSCQECNKNSYFAVVTHTAGSNDFIFSVNGVEDHNGRICGNKFALQGTSHQNSDCPGGNDVTIIGVLSSATSATAYSQWVCDYGGGTCSGKSQATATK